MSHISGYVLETWMIIYQWFVILHESAFKRWVAFTFCVRRVRIVWETNWRKIKMWIPCKTKQDSFDLSTDTNLPVSERWEWHMALFNWSFQTWKFSEQKRTDLMHTSIEIFLLWNKLNCRISAWSILYYSWVPNKLPPPVC